MQDAKCKMQNPSDPSDELEYVFRRIAAEYEKGKQLKFVRDPLAWALYRVWKWADEKRR